MKNKKVIRTLTAIALTAAIAAPITASAATITGGTPSKVTGQDVQTEQSGTTNLNLNATAMYIVTIPATITLEEVDGSAIYQGDGKITADHVHLDEGKKLEVTLGSDFQLDAEGGDSLTYKAAKDANFEQPIESDGSVGYFEANVGATADAALPIYFKTTQELKFAGTYQDTVTFTFSEVPVA